MRREPFQPNADGGRGAKKSGGALRVMGSVWRGSRAVCSLCSLLSMYLQAGGAKARGERRVGW